MPGNYSSKRGNPSSSRWIRKASAPLRSSSRPSSPAHRSPNRWISSARAIASAPESSPPSHPEQMRSKQRSSAIWLPPSPSASWEPPVRQHRNRCGKPGRSTNLCTRNSADNIGKILLFMLWLIISTPIIQWIEEMNTWFDFVPCSHEGCTNLALTNERECWDHLKDQLRFVERISTSGTTDQSFHRWVLAGI